MMDLYCASYVIDVLVSAFHKSAQQQERKTNWSAHAVLKLALEFRTDLREMFMQFVKFNAH